jgi:hypothetical protein
LAPQRGGHRRAKTPRLATDAFNIDAAAAAALEIFAG